MNDQEASGGAPVSRRRDRDIRRGRIISGSILVLLGLMFLLRNMFPWFRVEDFWPVSLIMIGAILVWKSRSQS